LLDSWRTVPGTDDNGSSINKELLFSWVTQARELMEKSGHKTIGEQQIGQLLSGSPRGADGAWPHETVRDLLEAVESTEIERGVMLGHYNSRGTTSRSPYEGGHQERILAKEYFDYASVIEVTWPRTGEILRKIAEDYVRQAKQEDDEANLSQDLST
jgi:hypothetical protein